MGFWTQPLGKTLAERKTGTSYQPAMLSLGGDGFVNLAHDGAMKYMHREGVKTRTERFTIQDVAAVSTGTEEAYLERTSVGRVAGGAILGAVLLGPLGAVLGGGIGSVRKKANLPAEYLVLELKDGNVYTVGVRADKIAQARKVRDMIQAGITQATGAMEDPSDG